MTLIDFATTIGTLAVATGKELDDETSEVYFAALRDVPVETFQAAVGRLVNSSRFFPSVGEIRASCDVVRAREGFGTFTVPALPATLSEDDPRVWFACPTCQDTGMASHWCVGSINVQPKWPDQFQSIGTCGSHACARFGEKGYGHEFMKRCVCYLTNPRIRERLEARRKFTDA